MQQWLYKDITSRLPNSCHSSCGQLDLMPVTINYNSFYGTLCMFIVIFIKIWPNTKLQL